MVWCEWGDAAFAQAAAERKPVLLSLVTAWSDECAAMDRTTYADPSVLSLIADDFIAIRVDADRRPDISERYNLGGWPTTAFLASSGELLSGGTYLSAEEMVATLKQVARAWRDASADLLERARALHLPDPRTGVMAPPPPEASADRQRLGGGEPNLARDVLDHFRALIVDRFDRAHGGFGHAPKLPHAPALLLALGLADDRSDDELATIVEFTLDKLTALCDPRSGGFYRYADSADWSDPGTEKALEDNAALLHLYLEAAQRRHSAPFGEQAAGIVRWIRDSMADTVNGGFYNAESGQGVDRSIYVDRNADTIAGFLRASVLFGDPWLRDFALQSLEATIVPGYAPGKGVAHEGAEGTGRRAEGRGLLCDQIRAASALIWAHATTERLPYSMLAAELAEFSIRTFWDAGQGLFRDRAQGAGDVGLLRDPVWPFDLNCEAACVLQRLATLTGDPSYADRARAILTSLARDYQRRGLFAAPYGLAVREIMEGRPPAGLHLARVDWGLE